MPSDAGSASGTSHRLHPASLLFSLGSAARRLLLPGVVILVAARGSHAEIWLMLLFLPTAAAALAKYLSFRYRFDAEELIVRQGIITRNERHIPYARIQNINLVQNPLHRLLRVSEVHLETAGGEKPEAVIRVISLQAVETLRAAVFSGRASAAPPQAESREAAPSAGASPEAAVEHRLLGLPLREVVLYGLLSNRGMAVVAAAMGAVWQFDLLQIDEGRVALAGREIGIPEIARPGAGTTVLLAVAAVLAALVLLRLFSVVLAVLKFSGFGLRLRGRDLRAEYGLLTRISATIPRHRIQLLSTRASPLYRWADRTAVQVETAGGRQEGEGAAVERLWLAPLMPTPKVPRLLREVLPEIDFEEVEWRPLARRARRRLLARSLIVLAIVTTVALVLLGPWALLLPAAAVPLAWLHATMFVRHAAWGVTGEAVIYRSGWWVRCMSVVRIAKIQALSMVESPFDRRHRMASLHVDTAGAGRIGHRVHIPFMNAAEARPLLDRLSHEAGLTDFRW